MLSANNEYRKMMDFANLGDKVKFDTNNFFPHTPVYRGPDEDSIKFLDDGATQLGDFFKRKHKLSGTFSSTIYNRSILASPYEAKFSNKKGKRLNFFSMNPESVYTNLFTSSFAAHENLRLSREIIFNDRYKIKNLGEFVLPETAIADFDILIPQYSKIGGLVKIRKYAPTEANIKKFANHGFLQPKSVTAEVRSLLSYENITAKSPAFK